MITLEPHSLLLVQSILEQYIPTKKVLLFGSRANNTAKPYSDIDLAVLSDVPLPVETLAQLRLAFEESDLPYKVDLVEWCTLTEAFQQIIKSAPVEVVHPENLS
ncbi:MAG: hypothetical protein DHS20C10_03530 [marine bacterium B5-7]|nr:MAG: hypothetical protein DHS20C10_03530 [marine bacterium B5-7]